MTGTPAAAMSYKAGGPEQRRVRTNLIQSTLVGEDGDMSVVSCCGEDGGQSGLR